jgi:hypothetical protein
MALRSSAVSFGFHVQGSMIDVHDAQTEQRSDADFVSCRQFGVLNQECRLNSKEEICQGVECCVC